MNAFDMVVTVFDLSFSLDVGKKMTLNDCD